MWREVKKWRVNVERVKVESIQGVSAAHSALIVLAEQSRAVLLFHSSQPHTQCCLHRSASKTPVFRLRSAMATHACTHTFVLLNLQGHQNCRT